MTLFGRTGPAAKSCEGPSIVIFVHNPNIFLSSWVDVSRVGTRGCKIFVCAHLYICICAFVNCISAFTQMYFFEVGLMYLCLGMVRHERMWGEKAKANLLSSAATDSNASAEQ